MNDLTFPPTASKHRSLLLYEASGTISVVKLGLNMPRGVEQNTEMHRFLRQCSCNPKHLNAGAIDVIKWRETPTACGTPHSRVTGVNVRPSPGPWERHRRATWAESTAGEAGQGEDCGALPHLPSGLQQRREGALRREPVQAGKEALGLGLWAPCRSGGSLSARPGGPAPDREPGTLPSSSSLLPLGVESRATAQRPQAPEGPAAARQESEWELGHPERARHGAPKLSKEGSAKEKDTPRRFPKKCALWSLPVTWRPWGGRNPCRNCRTETLMPLGEGGTRRTEEKLSSKTIFSFSQGEIKFLSLARNDYYKWFCSLFTCYVAHLVYVLKSFLPSF